tara:strand:- start:2327 stop:2584 length:258 start_codon:yes stop_codon:yes gene_type:complete
MAFKGTLPSELWLHYNQEGGRNLMDLDMHIAIEINDRIAEATSKSKKSGKGGLSPLSANDASSVVRRRNERREQRRKAQEGLNNT